MSGKIFLYVGAVFLLAALLSPFFVEERYAHGVVTSVTSPGFIIWYNGIMAITLLRNFPKEASDLILLPLLLVLPIASLGNILQLVFPLFPDLISRRFFRWF